MNSILDQINPDTAEALAGEAHARGLSVDEYLRRLLPQTNGDDNSSPLYETASTEEWVRAFREWAADHPSIQVADDSRETIYQGRGE